MVLLSKDNVEKLDIDMEKIWDSMGGFSSYSFNKSHSLAYSMIGYATMELFTYRWEEFIQYHLNYGSKEKFDAAIDKLKAAGYKSVYPNYTNMKSDRNIVYSNRTRTKKDGTTYIPESPGTEYEENYLLSNDGSIRQYILAGHERSQYQSLKDALFDNTAAGSAFLKGCFEFIIDGSQNNRVFTRDRVGLQTLINSLPKKSKDKMMFAPIENDITLEELLDKMVQAGVVTTYEKSRSREYKVHVKPYREANPDKIVTIRSNNDSDVLLENIDYDTSYFGVTRDGLIGKAPTELDENEMFWNALTSFLERKREQADDLYGEGWYDKEKNLKNRYLDMAKKAMNDKLDHVKYKEREDNNPRIKEPVRAIVTDLRSYSRSARLSLKFADKEDFFYVQSNWYEPLKKLGKKAVISVVFYFSPFIQHRTGDYIEDYDVIRITDLETGKFLDKNAVIYSHIDDYGREVYMPNLNWTDKLRTHAEDINEKVE